MSIADNPDTALLMRCGDAGRGGAWCCTNERLGDALGYWRRERHVLPSSHHRGERLRHRYTLIHTTHCTHLHCYLFVFLHFALNYQVCNPTGAMRPI
jgi:hypothetical protein